ncbi:hypothetical protein ES703_50016 [subsurface metagenome]
MTNSGGLKIAKIIIVSVSIVVISAVLLGLFLSCLGNWEKFKEIEEEIQWQTKLGGGDWESAYSIQQTSDDGYIVAGRSESSTVAGPALLQSHQGSGDCYIVKLHEF